MFHSLKERFKSKRQASFDLKASVKQALVMLARCSREYQIDKECQ